MRLGSDHVRVRVPATSANLGPGFDSLGLALAHHDEIEVRALGSTQVVVEVTGEGADDLPAGEDHLVVRAIRAALDHVGAPQVGLHLVCHNAIPHGRGMGSSASAVVAGILAARLLIGDPDALDDHTALQIANAFEGHPDNAAPALLGGVTVAWTDDQGARASVLPVHPEVVPLVLVPVERCATRTARGVLPATVPHADAAWTAGRAALLVQALCHRPDLLLPATGDRLHQDYRAGVMATTVELVRGLRAAGEAAVVSGAGPSVLVLTTVSTIGRAEAAVAELLGPSGPDGTTRSGWRVLRPGIARTGARAVRV
ncbi:homoserine kinase [Actinotalea sp. K2]|uniref:homoserine kinase n=1 Tax=Actinotalea sp. K2 TaxID=2939438 RepID=UPI0020178FF6|nr:homoserine kinase [Actinotalea sp. K2]MCL3860440.1 homoserine kinase [Actinotalea sp. K2]